MKELHDTERHLRKIWVSEGRPRGMDHASYKNYKHAKRNFRNQLNAEHERFISNAFRDIDEASECDVRLLWKLMKRLRPRNVRTYPVIDFEGRSYDDPSGVSLAFAQHFYDICNPQETDNFDSNIFSEIESSFINLENILKFSSASIPGGSVCINETCDIVRGLKRRTAPGLDRIQNEHCIYGGIRLSKCITYLFNAIIKVGRIPSCWKKDLIVPIYKGHNKPRKSPDSYRPIALLPCLLKVFEKLILTRIRTYIQPYIKFPNDQQQGFQQNLG